MFQPMAVWLRYRCPVADATDVVLCDSQWNSSGLIA